MFQESASALSFDIVFIGRTTMAKRRNRKLKKFWKYIGKIILYFLALGLGAPIMDFMDLIAAYSDPKHWLMCFIIVLVGVTLEFLVVEEIIKFNIPSFYFCSLVLGFIAMPLVLSMFVGSLFVIFWNFESLFIEISLVILVLAVCAVIIYTAWFRGVAVYGDGTVKIFKFKVKTYKDATVDDIKIEYGGMKCKIIITVNGEDNVFYALAVTGRACAPRLKTLLEI
jgi:hypothetical protein